MPPREPLVRRGGFCRIQRCDLGIGPRRHMHQDPCFLPGSLRRRQLRIQPIEFRIRVGGGGRSVHT
jgi:hypothetical protein